METSSTRALTSQLADDLGWLEEHSRLLPDQARATNQLRLAAALVRNTIGPFLDQQAPAPLHIVVVGGAGAGKSTVANLLSGAPAAESNPQAGFTRHPIAYIQQDANPDGALNWASHLNFLGSLSRLTTPSPSNLDEDVYQIRRVPNDPANFNLLEDFVIWDCPDMTTWAAEGYIPRLIEVAALADIIVYVASDERYNDEIPTQFLRLLLHTGKPVVCTVVKMREADAPALVAHFQKEVVGSMGPAGRNVVGTVAIPFLPREALSDPARQAGRYRIPLLNQVAVLGSPATPARRRTVAGAMQFLAQTQEQLLQVARLDVRTLETWKLLVQNGQQEFENRYNREYLTTEKFRGFDEAMIRLLELLELPGLAGKVVGGVFYVMRTPYRLLRGLITQAFSRPDVIGRPEAPILEEALAGWLDMLRKESARRATEHQLWRHISQGFHSGGLIHGTREKFDSAYRSFQADLVVEIDRTARSIYEELAKKPATLNMLRGGKLALDVAALGATVAAGGWGLQDLILFPLATSITHQLVELLGRQVVETHREQTRQRQQALMSQRLAQPLAEYLIQWPATGGSSFERLQLALRRIPEAIDLMQARVRQTLAG
jgi:hypothetical protein